MNKEEGSNKKAIKGSQKGYVKAYIVTPPPSGAASPNTWAERDAVPQRKNYIIEQQNALNDPGYIAKVWAHYNTIRGAPIPT